AEQRGSRRSQYVPRRTDTVKAWFIRHRRPLVVFSAIGCCAIACVVAWLSAPSPVERLQPYIGRDLRALSEDEQMRIDEYVGRLAPDAKVFERPKRRMTWDPADSLDHLQARPTAFYRRSWYIWRVTNALGQDRLVLFQGEPLWAIPGSSSARTFVFDNNGHLL